jgi:hypothetical protein
LPLATALLVVATGLAWWLLSRRITLTSRPYTKRRNWQVVGWLVAAVVVALVTQITVSSYDFPSSSGAWTTLGHVWGDAPLHVALISQFSHGDTLDLISPVYKQVPLTYPFMADLWSGVLMRLTSDWHIGLMLPSLMVLLALIQLLFSFGYRLLQSAYGAWLSWLMIIFSGSFHGGILLCWILLTQGYDAYVARVGMSFANTGDNYLNFLYSHPLPQRTFGFGMILAIVVAIVALELYRQRHKRVERNANTIAGAITGVLLGLMPLVHTHSFMLMIGVLVLATMGLWWFERKLPDGWLWLVGAALAVGTSQAVWQFASTYHQGFSHWVFGWMVDNFELVRRNWIDYWLRNVGWLFVMILVGWVWLRRAKVKPEVWLVYVSGVLIFAICNVYVFQPNAWDNMKFFVYGFWMIMLATAAVMMSWRKRRWGKAVTIGLMLSLCTTGVLSLAVSGPRLHAQILSNGDAKFGYDMSEKLPPNAYVLTDGRHNNPLMMLSQRKIMIAARNWQNLYDGDGAIADADRNHMLSGGVYAQSLIRKYGVTMVMFTERQVSSGEVDSAFFWRHYQLFYHRYGWWVFDLSQPPTT